MTHIAMVPVFSLSDGYLLGMTAWLAAGCAALVACLRLRRRWRQPEAAGGKPQRVKWTSLALSIWLFLAGVTLVELAFALFVDRTDSFSRTNISRRWFNLHVERNDAGFRDKYPFPRDRKPGQRRIVFLGDSFTLGHGVDVDQRFSERIAAAFDTETPGRFLVTNAAEVGLGTRNIVDNILPRVLESCTRGDVVVYTIVLNDIEDFDEERAAAFYKTVDSLDPSVFLFRDTYFLNLLYYRLSVLSQPEVRDYYGFLQESWNGKPWARMESKLEELIARCRARGIELRIAIFPFLHNLGPSYPFADAHKRLTTFFEREGIPCLDLRSVLEPHIAEGLVVNASDAHPSPRAHQLAADAMQHRLLKDVGDASDSNPR